MRAFHRVFAASVFLVGVSAASAQIVRIGSGAFTPEASVITFSEYPTGTNNPVYTKATASLGTVTVSFGPGFVGQSVVGGGVRTLTGSPTGPLTLDLLHGNPTFITSDGANPTSPVLSGSPRFSGPVSVLFSTPVAAVGLGGGYFDAIGGTSISAFDATGGLLGTVTNQAYGIEFFGLSTVTGASVISGISFYITGDEPAGFAIDNLTFGSGAEVVIPNPNPGAVPEPSTYGLIGVAALLALVGYRRFKRA